MAVSHLTPVPRFTGAPEVYDLGKGPEKTSDRVRRLQAEARILAREQTELLARDLMAMAVRAQEIADGGDAYPAGIREMASRIATELPQKAQGLTAITERMPL
jgi:hypothetical protein